MIAHGYDSSLCREYILEHTSEEAIIKYYFNIDRVPCVVNSPLRVDNNPSFGIYYSTDGIAFRDFKTNDRGSLIDMIRQHFNLSYHGALDRIMLDIDNIKNVKGIKIVEELKSQRRSNKKSTHKEISVIIRSWKYYDLLFWEKYGLTKEWLEFGDIYPISHFYIGDNKLVADKLAYCYVENKDNITTYKIYQPQSKVLKWINNHNSSVWDLWSKLPEKGEKLIITSSRKDALCLWAGTNIPSTSLQAESYLPKKKVIDELKERFDIIYSFYDNDYDREVNYGRIYNKKLSEEFDLKMIEIPDIYKSKDPSDLYKKIKNKKLFNKIITELL